MGPSPTLFPFLISHSPAAIDLIRRVFQTHPEVHVPPRAPFFIRIASLRWELERADGVDVEGLVAALDAEPLFEAWRLSGEEVAAALTPVPSDLPDAFRALYRVAAAKAGKPRYADGTRLAVRNVLPLSLLFPEGRFIHVVEDPRTFAVRLAPEGITSAGAADRWRETIEVFLDGSNALPPGVVTTIRYEDLIADPLGQVKAAVAAVGLDLDPSGFRAVEPEERPPALDKADARTVELITADLMWRFEYRPVSARHPLSFTDRKRLIGVIDSGGRPPRRTLKEIARDAVERAPAVRRGLRRLKRAVRR